MSMLPATQIDASNWCLVFNVKMSFPVSPDGLAELIMPQLRVSNSTGLRLPIEEWRLLGL
jgi:hypothetical protein